jgi:hypothetical protein
MLTPYHHELGATIILAHKDLVRTVGHVVCAPTRNAEAGANPTMARASPNPINGHHRDGRN